MHANDEERGGPGRPRNPDQTQQRREAILRQAILHFARQGYTRADMGEIARSAGCAKGTIYNYFSSKRELFREAVDSVMRGVLEATSSAHAEDPVEAIGLAIRKFLAYFDEHPEYIELLIQERADFKDRNIPSYREYCQTQHKRRGGKFQLLIDQGVFRPFPVDRVLEIVGDLLYGTIFTNHFAGRTPNLEQQAADIMDLLLNGLLARDKSIQ